MHSRSKGDVLIQVLQGDSTGTWHTAERRKKLEILRDFLPLSNFNYSWSKRNSATSFFISVSVIALH